jgi:hypothetical protein
MCLCTECLLNILHTGREHLYTGVLGLALFSSPHIEGSGANWSYILVGRYSVVCGHADARINKHQLLLVRKREHSLVHHPRESQYDITTVYFGQHI